MKLSKITILIYCMLLAIIGLMAFQGYWINLSIKESRVRFEYGIRSALDNTAKEIEKQEVVFLTKQKIVLEEKRKLLELAKNKNLKIKATSSTMNFIKKEGEYINIVPKEIITIEYKNEAFPKSVVPADKMIILPEKQGEYLKQFITSNYENAELFYNDKNVLTKQYNIDEFLKMVDADPFFSASTNEVYFSKKSNKDKASLEMVKSIYKDFMQGKRNVYERLNHIMVDTILKKQLIDQGIETRYMFTVKDKGKTIFTSLNKPIKKTHEVKLFKNSAVEQNQMLELSFPDKDEFVIKKTWPVMASSFLIVIIVGGLFYFSASTLLSQNKLATIKNDFINNMTHELKTPVSTISLAMEILQDKTLIKNPEKTERYLSIIDQENKRLGGQIEKVLNMAKLEKGDIDLKYESFDLQEIIPEVIKNLSVQLEHKNADLKVFKKPRTLFVLMADKVHITNIVYNLLDNAIKYGGPNPEISLSLHKTHSFISLSVNDKGPGIDEEHQNKIFDKFYRVSNGNLHDTKGYGLGLSYVKRIAELHGGEVTVDSNADTGTTFTIYFPA